MKLLVLGATGGIGLELVRQAIDHGHSVTALVRRPEPLQVFDGHLTVVQGDLLNGSQLEQTLAGHDAVLSGFGPRVPVSNSEAHLLQQFAVGVTSAMLRAGISRLVLVSVAFLFKDSILPPAYLAGRLFYPITVADASAMEHVVTGSGLDWTIVRPPQLTDRPRTGHYRVREEHLPWFGFTIARADVADFMLQSVENHLSSHTIVGVSN